MILYQEYVEKLCNGRQVFGREILWMLAEIFECEVNIYYESGGKTTYREGKLNLNFGKLEFLVSCEGEIEKNAGDQDAYGLVDGIITATHNTDGEEGYGEHLMDKSELRKDYTQNKQRFIIEETSKGKTINNGTNMGIKDCLILGIQQVHDLGGMDDHNYKIAKQRVGNFFEIYDQLEKSRDGCMQERKTKYGCC